MSFLSQIKNFFSKYWEQILMLVGLLTLFAGSLYLIFLGLRFISDLPGFRFDPFALVALVFATYYFSQNFRLLTQALENQTKLLKQVVQNQKSSLKTKAKSVAKSTSYPSTTKKSKSSKKSKKS